MAVGGPQPWASISTRKEDAVRPFHLRCLQLTPQPPGPAEKPPFGKWGPKRAAGALLSVHPAALPGPQTHSHSLSA